MGNPDLILWLASDAPIDPLTANLPVTITGAFLLLATLATAVFGLVNRKQDSKSRREPTVAEVWARLGTVETKLDTEHEARLAIESRYYALRNAFYNYVERVKRGGIAVDLTADERSALEDTREHAPDDLHR